MAQPATAPPPPPHCTQPNAIRFLLKSIMPSYALQNICFIWPTAAYIKELCGVPIYKKLFFIILKYGNAKKHKEGECFLF